MSIRLHQLLDTWYPLRDERQWVLGTIYQTEGPTYRKAGAMMLFDDMGQQLGLLSGGCLEADIQLKARKVMEAQQALSVCYDGSDEDDVAFQLGIGCGGVVHIVLQPIHANNHYLGLDALRENLVAGKSSLFCQLLPSRNGQFSPVEIHQLEQGCEYPGEFGFLQVESSGVVAHDEQQWSVSVVKPNPVLLVVGGGVDARPMVRIAAELGWKVILCDPRTANARQKYFPDAHVLFREPPAALANTEFFYRIDAAIVMAHNLDIDAEALRVLQSSSLRYLALLGPAARREKVMAMAGLSGNDLPAALAGPAGLDIGGGLPESIALSILAECHAVLEQRPATSLCKII